MRHVLVSLGGYLAPVGGPVGRPLRPLPDHPLPERLPLRGRGLLARLPGPHRRRPGQNHHRRHGLLLVLFRNQHRARHQGPRRPLDQPEILGLLRRAHVGRVRPDGDGHGHRRRQDVPQPSRPVRERRRHGRVRSRVTAPTHEIVSIEGTFDPSRVARGHPEIHRGARLRSPPPPSRPAPEQRRGLSLPTAAFGSKSTGRTPAAAPAPGRPVQLTNDTGYFWFFSDANVELMVKVLDARSDQRNFWVFFGALSNVEYTLQSPTP